MLCSRPGINGGEVNSPGRAFERDGVERSNCSSKGFKWCEPSSFGCLPLWGASSRAKDGREWGAMWSDPSFLALPVGCNDFARRPFDEGATSVHEYERTRETWIHDMLTSLHAILPHHCPEQGGGRHEVKSVTFAPIRSAMSRFSKSANPPTFLMEIRCILPNLHKNSVAKQTGVVHSPYTSNIVMNYLGNNPRGVPVRVSLGYILKTVSAC